MGPTTGTGFMVPVDWLVTLIVLVGPQRVLLPNRAMLI